MFRYSRRKGLAMRRNIACSLTAGALVVVGVMSASPALAATIHVVPGLGTPVLVLGQHAADEFKHLGGGAEADPPPGQDMLDAAVDPFQSGIGFGTEPNDERLICSRHGTLPRHSVPCMGLVLP